MTPGVHAALANVQGVSGAKLDGTVVATGPQFYARVGCSARCDGISVARAIDRFTACLVTSNSRPLFLLDIVRKSVSWNLDAGDAPAENIRIPAECLPRGLTIYTPCH